MRVVIDSNVAIAAVASRGLCDAILELCLERHHLVLCEGILKEIEGTLTAKLKVPRPIVAEYLKVLRAHSEILEPEDVRKDACRDPNDVMILGLAVSGDAEVIVTGDKDLLVLGRYRKTKVVSPRAFWESCKQKE